MITQGVPASHTVRTRTLRPSARTRSLRDVKVSLSLAQNDRFPATHLTGAASRGLCIHRKHHSCLRQQQTLNFIVGKQATQLVEVVR